MLTGHWDNEESVGVLRTTGIASELARGPSLDVHIYGIIFPYQF